MSAIARPLAVLLLALAPVARAAPAEPVAEAIRAVAERCEVDAVLGWVASCPGGELGDLEEALQEDDALPALAALLADESPATRALAADRLALAYPDVVAEPEVVGPEVVDALLHGVSEATPYAASRALPALAGAAHRAGRLPEVLDALGRDASPALSALVPDALVTLLGAEALPTLATLAGSPSPEVLAATLHAATTVDGEVPEALCERAADVADDAGADVRVGSARVLSRCRPETVRRAVADDGGDPARRATLLWTLYEARPDAATRALARRVHAADAPLGPRADRIIRALVDVHGVEEEPEEPADPAVPDGTYRGRVRGTVDGSLQFTVRGGRVTGAQATLGRVRLPLRGELTGASVRLTGSSDGNYARFRGRVQPSGAASGSWTGGVSKRVSKGSWSARR